MLYAQWHEKWRGKGSSFAVARIPMEFSGARMAWNMLFGLTHCNVNEQWTVNWALKVYHSIIVRENNIPLALKNINPLDTLVKMASEKEFSST